MIKDASICILLSLVPFLARRGLLKGANLVVEDPHQFYV